MKCIILFALLIFSSEQYASNFETQTDAPWGISRLDQTDLPVDQNYHYSLDGTNVHVFILDTGVQADHIEFTGRMGNGINTLLNSSTTAVGDDCSGHGTHVAGIVAGTNYGVAKNVTVHDVRVLDCLRKGTVDDLVSGIEWVTSTMQLPAVVNISISVPVVVGVDRIETAIRDSIDKGFIYVVSGGNNRSDACSLIPQRMPEVLTVGASTIYDELWDDSASDGSDYYGSNFGSCIDLFAPGEDILSAWNGAVSGDFPPCPDCCQTDCFGEATSTDDSRIRSGTSLAAPHVAGLVARFLQYNTTANQQQAKDFILEHAITDKLLMPSYTENTLTPNLLANLQMDFPSSDVSISMLSAEFLQCVGSSPSYLISYTSNVSSPMYTVEWSRDGSPWNHLYTGSSTFLSYSSESQTPEKIRVKVSDGSIVSEYKTTSFTSKRCSGISPFSSF